MGHWDIEDWAEQDLYEEEREDWEWEQTQRAEELREDLAFEEE